jgi:hypothetical protein
MLKARKSQNGIFQILRVNNPESNFTVLEKFSSKNECRNKDPLRKARTESIHEQ